MSVGDDVRLVDCPLVAVGCRRCGSELLVRKSSWNQTSVQWNAEASARCPERHAGMYSSRGVFLACAALRDSITDAVRRGDLPVVDEIC